MKYSFQKTVMLGLVLQSLAIISPHAAAGPVTVLNTFTSGTPASAAEVNANFSAIETAVNDNDSRISALIVRDGNDVEIGTLVEVSRDFNPSVKLMTQEDYVFEVFLGDGRVIESLMFSGNLVFSSIDCTGPAFAAVGNGFVMGRHGLTGVIALYYVPKDSLAVPNFSYGSLTDSSGCNVVSGTVPFAWSMLPNDQNITGAANTPYPLPIKFSGP